MTFIRHEVSNDIGRVAEWRILSMSTIKLLKSSILMRSLVLVGLDRVMGQNQFTTFLLYVTAGDLLL